MYIPVFYLKSHSTYLSVAKKLPIIIKSIVMWKCSEGVWCHSFIQKCPNHLLVFTCIYQFSTCRIGRMYHACPKACVLSSSKYSVLHFCKYRSIFPSSPEVLSGYSARCSGFNRSRCNEVECCTSELPFVLDSTPGRKPLSHIIIAH